jgi:predicted metal-dependent phosphoesterase TrpH
VNKLSDEFKILADKITAWNEYLERHKHCYQLNQVNWLDDASKAEIAKAAISFDEIKKYDELVAYTAERCVGNFTYSKIN